MTTNIVTVTKPGFTYKVTEKSKAQHPVPKEQRVIKEADRKSVV